MLSFLGQFVGLSLHFCHLSRQQHSAYFEVPAQRGSQARTACVAERLEPKAVPLRLLYLTPPRFELPEQTINMEPIDKHTRCRVGLRGRLHLLSFLGKFVGLSLHICHLSRQQLQLTLKFLLREAVKLAQHALLKGSSQRQFLCACYI